MKNLLFILVLFLGSCATIKETIVMKEDQFMITRRYVGKFEDYRITKKTKWNEADVIWVKTTQDSIYGKFGCYLQGKQIKFQKGDRIYVRRKFIQNPGDIAGSGYWLFVLENDKENNYKLMSFTIEEKVFYQ
jgi:hypothetical protein